MTYPNFLIIGTQKAGTRWMLNMLVQHPEIFMPTYEVHYFDQAENYARGPEWYASHFAKVRGEKAIGEKTPNYLILDEDDPGKRPRRIHELMPQAKLIAILRNPVERAISAINHHIRLGYVPADVDLDEAVRRFVAEDRAFIRYGYYHRHLTTYRQFFEPEQMLVLIYEDDVVARPRQTLARVCSFLGVDPTFDFSDLDKRVNESRMSPLSLKLAALLPGNRRWTARVTSAVERFLGVRSEKRRPGGGAIDQLYQLYAPENEKLFRLIGREVASWSKTDAYITR